MHVHACVLEGEFPCMEYPVCKTLVHIPWDAPWDFSDSGILNNLQNYRCGCVLGGGGGIPREYPVHIPWDTPWDTPWCTSTAVYIWVQEVHSASENKSQ